MEKGKSNTVFVITYLDWNENELHSEDHAAVDIKAATQYSLTQHKMHKAELIHIVPKES